MSKLLPCPFCGGDDVNMGVRPHFREGKGNGWTVLCADCGGSIGYIERPDGHFYAEYDTKSEAIAAWNTRVDYHGYEQAAIEAWESIKAWNSRAERTCKVISHKTFCGAGGCEEAGELWTLSCGHEVMNDSDFPPNFCDECGCKVVGE